MNHFLLRRKNRIISLILIVGTIFLLFQLFSFKVLNFTASRSIKFGGKHSGIVLGDVKDDPLVNNDNAADRASKDKDTNLKFQKQKVNNEALMRNAEQDHAVHVAEGLEELDLPKGVQMMQMNEYKKRADGMFQCLKSKELIPYSDVNDDYCDCGDSSDEPGTSACPESRFYCTFQYPDVAPLYITGSRVNDGVCDCCDGSDEWLGLHVFSGVHLTDKRLKDSLTHAPCKDTCLAVQKSNEDDARIRAMGKRLKQAYIVAGKKATDKHLYGPDGVFYQLSLSCFHEDVSEYKYSLCPFKSVTQQKFPDAAKTIGKSPEWKIKLANKGIYVLKMDKGEASGCPSSMFRNTVVTFICGLTDKILQVSEEEKCAYSMKFSTPAAC